MLLRNESRIVTTLHIRLVFDDETVKELDIAECDTVQVSYRKNGCVRVGVGIIKSIDPYIVHKFGECCNRHSAHIVLDMSEDHVSCVDKFDLFDIIDIKKVNLEEVSPGRVDSDFTVTSACCKCPVNNKEVIIRE